MHFYSEVKLTACTKAYSQVNMHKIMSTKLMRVDFVVFYILKINLCIEGSQLNLSFEMPFTKAPLHIGFRGSHN